MADEGFDQDQKTEEPTPKRLEDARKRGEVVGSREVNHLLALGGGAAALAFGAPHVVATLTPELAALLERSSALPMSLEGLVGLARAILLLVGAAIALPLGLMLAGGLLGGLIQHGPVFTVEPLAPRLERISLVKGFERLFSSRAVIELVKGLIKIAIVGGVAVIAVEPYFAQVVESAALEPGQLNALLVTLARRVTYAVVVVMAVVAGADYLLQRFQFMRRMRMSRQEIHDEYKQTEGDPTVKARLRQLRQERARRRMMAAVPQADVVIVNPTHVAVALEYEQATMPAPKLVAKGVDRVALKIREVAEANGVPIVENPPLARALHAGVELDAYIPEQHYRAVAEVIGYVMRLKGRLPRRNPRRA
jgi:flagellar biosynthetic protein FlhB